ncbi:MAG: TlpA family protein disulfide reductase [Vicinamibacteria bacterium]|nr:TlpA family protein disulfide reductase [Vicinamibacteria bacterium]
MIFSPFVLTLAFITAPQAASSTDAPTAETKIVDYLKANVKPGQPVVVSTLFNEVFTTPPERKALNRLFNTFFKIPLFVVQVQKATGKPPSLMQISEQFAFTVPGTANVILRIMEADPRMPKFLDRDPQTGEILEADVDRIMNHPRFGKILERTITGWEGNPAPAFAVKNYDGSDLSLATMTGKPFLLYFWFTNCPPCVATSPLLVELDKVYGPKGFTIIGLNSDKLLELDYTDEDRAAYAAKLSIKFVLAHANAEAQNAYGGVSVFPTLFFVDKAGIVVTHLVNGQDKAVLEASVKLALK